MVRAVAFGEGLEPNELLDVTLPLGWERADDMAIGALFGTVTKCTTMLARHQN